MTDLDRTRLGVLRRYQELLGGTAQADLHQICRVARTLTGASMAAVHLIDGITAHRIAAEGLPLVAVPAGDALCAVVLSSGTPVSTPDASCDPRFCGPYTRGSSPVRFYAGTPLRAPDGSVLGTLCALDGEVRTPDAEHLAALDDLALSVVTTLELRRVAHDLAHVATHDPLTGLANRTLLTAQLTQAVARREQPLGAPLLAVLDLDGFKQVNDQHGHAAGDAVLVEVAARLRSACRAQDTLARLGGDEFVLLVTDPGRLAPAALQARLVALLDEPLTRAGLPLHVRGSVGVVSCAPGAAAADVLAAADAAMYDAKRGGRVVPAPR